ncbi:MAG: winged helix-turn-helix transcriptional regulator [Clostridia bacterium]|nr:winged helix-turn-helix transcriptional regulator [Clostridia bacterium]MBQ2434419.1 winged helix-turn-helix transcriptional regulator [Clostridia bacterium]MBQ5770303.1 winged helix-turn-helix transcriptional regulator [Clostridia bacterium]
MNKFICEINETHPHSIAIAKANMPKEDEVLMLASIFKVLSDPTRVKLLLAMKDQELCVCDLAALLNMTKSAISHQLKTMKECHVVKSRRDGKNIFYSLDDQHVTDILSLARLHAWHTKS